MSRSRGGTTHTEVEVRKDAAAVGERFAQLVAELSPQSIALSRPTPAEAFLLAGRLEVTARVFQVDERAAPESSDDRNATLIERTLPLWTGRFCAMPVGGDLEVGAAHYETLLVDALGTPPVIDLLHLGLGPDGHTASLLPGDPVLEVDDRWVALTQEHNGFRRMTLTYPTLAAARVIVLVVTGNQKAEVVKRVLNGDRSVPASRIDHDNVTVLLDEEAAARL